MVQEALRPLLKIAMQGDKSAPEQIGSQIKSLAAKTGDDPRLHYLHGLVLLKNFRHAEAIAAMQAGADSKTYYFPIHHVLIYEQIRQKQYDTAIESLLDLSARIGDPGQLWTSEEDRLEAARWLGRMVAYLQGPCANTEVAARLQIAIPVMRSQLTPVYETEMEGGVNELHTDHRELQIQLLSTMSNALAEKKSQAHAAEETAAKLNEQRKDLTVSAREQVAVSEEQLREIDSQLSALEKQYAALQSSHDRINDQIRSVRSEIFSLPTMFYMSQQMLRASQSSPFPSQSIVGARQALSVSEAIAIKEAELQTYLIDLQTNANQQRELMGKAQQVLDARKQAVTQLESQGKRSEQVAHGITRWEKRLAQSRKRSLVSIDRKTDSVRSRISSLSSYEALNASEELAHFVDSQSEAISVP